MRAALDRGAEVAVVHRGHSPLPVPDDALPGDLALTRGTGAHLMMSSAKARRVPGYADTPRDEAVARSVAWHLEHPDPDPFDPTADDAALESTHG